MDRQIQSGQWIRSLFVIFVLSFSPSLPSEPVTSVAAIAAAADQLDKVAQDALVSGDTILHERIQQAVNGLRLILKDLESTIKSVEGPGNELLNSASRDALEILATLHVDGRAAGAYGSAKLNQSLASVSGLIDELPLVDVPPSLLAMSPTRIEMDQRQRSIRVFGHLPGEVGDDVVIHVGENEQEVKARRGSGGSISFSLPAKLALKQEQRLPIKIKATEHYGPWNLLWRTHEFEEVLLIGKQKPFSCNVDSFDENPEYLRRVKATGTTYVDASTQGGARREYVDRSFNADDLFIQTMGADVAQAYDLKTVVILDLGYTFQRWGQCRNQGPTTTAQILSGGKQAQVAVRAPPVRRTLQCSPGGTHGRGTLQPTFLVARKDAQPTKLVDTKAYTFGSQGISIDYPAPVGDRWAVHVKCSYQEAGDSWSARTMVIHGADKQESARGMLAQLRDGRLIVEPLDPLKFDDQLR